MSPARLRNSGLGIDPDTIKTEAQFRLPQPSSRFSSADTIDNGNLILNTGTSDGVAVLGSTAGVDTNDPTVLVHGGADYVRFPGTTGNLIQRDTLLDMSGDCRAEVIFEGTWSDVPVKSYAGFTGDRLGTDSMGYGLRRENVSDQLQFYWLKAGPSFQFALSSVGVPPSAVGIAAERTNSDAGNSGFYTVRFEYTLDGETWQALGAEQFGSAVGAPIASTRSPIIGQDGSLNCSASLRSVSLFPTGLGGIVDVWTPNTAGWTVTRSATGLKTTVVTKTVLVLDGVDDYLQLPASDAPTFTKTSGKYSVAMLFRLHDLTSVLWMFSSRIGSSTGLEIVKVTSTVIARCGGDGIYVDATVTYGDPFQWVALFVVVDDGQMTLHNTNTGQESTVSLAPIDGTLTHGPPRVGSIGSGVALCIDMDFATVVVFNGVALSKTERETIGAQLIAGTYK